MSVAHPFCIASRRRRRAGLTLIELVIVVVILATLAALIIPRLGNTERNSRLTASVSNINNTTKMFETFKAASKGKHPDGFDSLISATTTTIYPGNGNLLQNRGVFSSWLTTTVLTTTELGVLKRVSPNVVGSGPSGTNVAVYDHDESVSNPHATTDASTARNLDTTGSVAMVNTTTGASVYRAFNLNPADANYKLLAFGVGPRCTLVGRNDFGIAVAEASTAGDPAPNSEFSYARPIVLIRIPISTTVGLFPEFVGTVNSYGKTAGEIRTFIQ